MSALTSAQRATAGAYAAIFADGAQARVVLDDMQTAIHAMPDAHQAGAWRLYGYIQLKASLLRRAKRNEAK